MFFQGAIDYSNQRNVNERKHWKSILIKFVQKVNSTIHSIKFIELLISPSINYSVWHVKALKQSHCKESRTLSNRIGLVAVTTQLSILI